MGSSMGAPRRCICAVALALVAVACGDTGDTGPTIEEPATATVEAVTSATAEPTTTVAATATAGQTTTTAQDSALEPLEVAELWLAA